MIQCHSRLGPARRADFDRSLRVAIGSLVAILVFWATNAASYDYPIQDAYLATVIGTRVADEGPAPKKIPTRTRSRAISRA